MNYPRPAVIFGAIGLAACNTFMEVEGPVAIDNNQSNNLNNSNNSTSSNNQNNSNNSNNSTTGSNNSNNSTTGSNNQNNSNNINPNALPQIAWTDCGREQSVPVTFSPLTRAKDDPGSYIMDAAALGEIARFTYTRHIALPTMLDFVEGDWVATGEFDKPEFGNNRTFKDVRVQTLETGFAHIYAGAACYGTSQSYGWYDEVFDGDVVPTVDLGFSGPCDAMSAPSESAVIVGGKNPVDGQVSSPFYVWLRTGTLHTYNDNTGLWTNAATSLLTSPHRLESSYGAMAAFQDEEGKVFLFDPAKNRIEALPVTNTGDRPTFMYVTSSGSEDYYILGLENGASTDFWVVMCADPGCGLKPLRDIDDEALRPAVVGGKIRLVPIKGGFVVLSFTANRLAWDTYGFVSGTRVRHMPTLSGFLETNQLVDAAATLAHVDGSCRADLVLGLVNDGLEFRSYGYEVFFGHP